MQCSNILIVHCQLHIGYLRILWITTTKISEQNHISGMSRFAKAIWGCFCQIAFITALFIPTFVLFSIFCVYSKKIVAMNEAEFQILAVFRLREFNISRISKDVDGVYLLQCNQLENYIYSHGL